MKRLDINIEIFTIETEVVQEKETVAASIEEAEIMTLSILQQVRHDKRSSGGHGIRQ